MKISAYSTALFSTFFFLEEYGILFDCGDGAAAMLMGKSRKVKHIFISHADRDHLCGLLQFNQLNAREGFPKVYFPRDCGSFPYLEAFTKQFDPHVSGTEWDFLDDGQEVKIGKGLLVRAFRNEHIAHQKDTVKSLSFQLIRTTQKLKEAYLELSGSEIKAKKEEIGYDEMTYEKREILLTYSGDTPVEWDGRYNDSQMLIHEATFLKKEDMGVDGNRWNKHSTLDEVMKMISESKGIERLVLSHFSSRYHADEIQQAVEDEARRHAVDIPISLVLPGVFSRNILD